jgi:hypothetical protein
MKFVTGTDHNLSFRFIPSPPNNENYELHFGAPGDFILGVPNGTYNVNAGGYYTNGQTYHIKVIIQGKNIKVLIDNKLIRDFILDNPLPSGKIALRAGTGADTNSETWFDNVKVVSLPEASPNLLNVPYFSQNASPWGKQEYDHAKSLGFSDLTMDRWGCAVTSAAMVLNYHNIKQFGNGTAITPGTLNDWLKNYKNGYVTGYGSDGSYSSINWNAVSILTRDLFNLGKAPYKLEYQGLQVAGNNFPSINAQLDSDLENNIPDILWVRNASTSGHFVVATGKEGSKYFINDPEWDVKTLDSFYSPYMQLGRYVPSHTDLSYLMFVVNPDVHIMVTAPDGKKTGTQWVNGSTMQEDSIQNAWYGFSPAISNPNKSGNEESLGTGVNMFILPKPTNGEYKIQLTSNRLQPFTLNLLAYDVNGNELAKKQYGFTEKGNALVYSLNYSQNAASQISTPKVTFESTIKDIKNLSTLKQCNPVFASGLIQMVKSAQLMAKFNKKKQANELLSLAINLLNKSKKFISPIAYETIIFDLTTLKNSL